MRFYYFAVSGSTAILLPKKFFVDQTFETPENGY